MNKTKFPIDLIVRREDGNLLIVGEYDTPIGIDASDGDAVAIYTRSATAIYREEPRFENRKGNQIRRRKAKP